MSNYTPYQWMHGDDDNQDYHVRRYRDHEAAIALDNALIIELNTKMLDETVRLNHLYSRSLLETKSVIVFDPLPFRK